MCEFSVHKNIKIQQTYFVLVVRWPDSSLRGQALAQAFQRGFCMFPLYLSGFLPATQALTHVKKNDKMDVMLIVELNWCESECQI